MKSLQTYFCIIMMMITIHVTLYSQTKADTLLSSLDNADEHDKAEIYNELSSYYISEQNYTESRNFGEQALELAKKMKDEQNLMDAYNNLANIEIALGNYNKGMEYADNAIIYSKKQEDENACALAYNLLGNANYFISEYDSALEYWQKSLEIREKQGAMDQAATLIMNIGIIYKNKGEYKKAIENNEKALKIQKEMGNENMVGQILGNIGNIYFYSGLDYLKALDYYTESLDYFKKVNNRFGEATLYNSIGLIYKEQDSLGKALEYYNQSLQIFDEIEYPTGKAQALNSIGGIYLEQKNLQKSLEYFYQSLEIFEKIGAKRDAALTHNDIGTVFFLKKNYRRALRYKLSALYIMKELDSKKEMSDMYKEISDIYAELNDFEDAYKYHHYYSELKDSIITTEYTNQISEWQTRYQTDKKEKELIIQKAQNQKQESEIKRKNILLYSFVGLISIVLIFSFLLYKQFNEKKKANILLSEKNEQITKQNKEITDSIQYASRIQNAVLPSSDQLNKLVEDHFILFKPKDIVSGDFYWMTANEHKAALVAADCTGHGVPGAFMSMLGISFLTEIIDIDEDIQANEILNELRHMVKTTLAQSGENVANDGMDISLLILDKKNMKIQFSGAYNSLYIFKNNELHKIKADRMPIGNYVKETKPFTNNVLEINNGEVFYMFSDGYVDQFGGENDTKFSIKSLRELLTDIHKKPMHEQRKILHNNFAQWKGDRRQVDDVLIFGIKI